MSNFDFYPIIFHCFKVLIEFSFIKRVKIMQTENK